MSALLQTSSLAGLDAESGPLWFKPEKFLDPKFNPEAYVNDLKRYVPLDTLNATLAEHAEALRDRLVEVVNEDYDEFVSLSTKLVDVDGAVARLAAPLADVRARVEAARAAVAAQADALQEGLARRQAAAAARALLELAQDAVHAAAKVDKLLEELVADKAAAPGAPEGDVAAREAAQEALEVRARLLDRACSEVSRLHFFAARGQELAVVRAMAPRVERASAALRAELDAALAATLVAQNPAALGVLLHAYGSLGAPEAAESVVRAQVVAPVVVAAVQGAREAAAARAADATLPPPALSLSEVLPAIEAALREHAGPFLELAMTTGGGAAAFDFLGGSVLPEALAAAEAACPGCYSPGLPDAFHANYLASAAFLAALEGLCATPVQVERLRASPAAVAHRKKWNLAAYFSLRFQDVAGELEEALRGAGLAPAAPAGAAAAEGGPAGPTFEFAATAATWRALEACVDPDTFLPPLADRFLRLALQAVARAATWAEDGAAAAEAAGAAAAAQTAAPGESDAQARQQEQREDGADDGSKPWGAEATAEQLASLSQDLTALQSALSSHLLPRFEALVTPAGGASAGEALAAAFDEAESRVGSAADAVVTAAASRLVSRCCEALRQLRGIVATFRMTSRGAPTRPAQYAGAILAPLGQFLSGPGAGLGEPARGALAAAVVGGVAERYAALAHDTLSTVRKTESSLRRLKSRKAPGAEAGKEAGAAPGAEQLGTDELIALQLRLDFEEFGRRVTECGVDPGTVAAVAVLHSVLDAPEEK